MADDDAVDEDDDVFIYRGGRAPLYVSHVLIDESVHEIQDDAFDHCMNLLTVDTHDGIRKIGAHSFSWCGSLRQISLKSAVEVNEEAFYGCENLESVEFGVRLEIIGQHSFAWTLLTELKLPSIITIGNHAFWNCKRLTDIELSGRLQTIGKSAFYNCESLQRIAIPLKRDLFEFSNMWQKYDQFDDCRQLTTIDLVGGIHKTVASLHMESWRTEMNEEINQINQVLPNAPADEKTDEIRQWMHSVVDKMDQFKDKHYRYVKEGITLLELALWKAKLGDKEENTEERAKKAKVDAASARKDKHITCGADMVIKNVLPFLELQ